MISKLLLIVSLTLTIIPYILLLITYISSKKEKKITASENILKILENDSSINFIENKESIFSHYNIKRKIIKLSSKTYDSRTIFSLAVSSLLAGFSLINNKLINYLSYIINKLKIITILPIIAIILSIYVHTIADAKIAMFIIIILAVIEYIINYLITLAINNINIKDKDISKILNIFILNTKIYFIAVLIQILRLFLIILNI